MNYGNIREARISDAKNIIEYIEKVSDETDFLISDSSERDLNVSREAEFLQNMRKYKNNNIFIYEKDEKIAGICGISGVNKKRIKHRVNLSVSVLKEYWGLGIATKLMEYAVFYAKENSIKKIELAVRTDNYRALRLYNKFGFDIEGEIKNFFYLNESYYNCYFMGLLL